MSNPLATDRWAEVAAGGHVTRYRRAGAGRAVLLLCPDTLHAAWPALAERLAARYRLVLPEPPASDGPVANWLAAFLEGLGTADVALVAAEPFCTAALEAASVDGGQIERVLLLSDEAGGETSVPLRVLSRTLAEADTLAALETFLDAPAAG